VGPVQAIDVNQSLRGKMLLPIHWGTFNIEPAHKLKINRSKIAKM